jgi:methyltransferase (TIGR00027 family)
MVVMVEGTPSGTAYRVALRRAAHQAFDHPLVFADPLAVRIVGADRKGSSAQLDLRAPSRPTSVSLRAFLVARSRFAEDTLEAAFNAGVRQYVLLGAGLDTFAYRNPHANLRVFEVDHPDTQRWKLSLLGDNGISVPSSTTHVAVDFHHDVLAERLEAAGFDATQPAVFAWLGVVPYLTDEGFTATMRTLSSYAQSSVLVMDYGLPRESLSLLERLAFDSMAARVAAAGEPFRLFFEPQALHARLAEYGWEVIADLDRDSTNERYFRNRTDGLRILGGGGHLLSAKLARPVIAG